MTTMTPQRAVVLQSCIDGNGYVVLAPGKKGRTQSGGRTKMLQAMRRDGLIDVDNKITAAGSAALERFSHNGRPSLPSLKGYGT